MRDGSVLAAIDLGSNSFRLEVGQFELGQIQRREYLKETVRQGNGLDEDRNLTPQAIERGLQCLSRFAERLKGFHTSHVRAVATQTLREARNRDQFLRQATQVLGFEIDVISGREEARLIYLGVAHHLPLSEEKRLVIDIGGRSTEMILGKGFDASVMESYRVGSVSWSMKYFGKSQFSKSAFRAAIVAAQAVLEDIAQTYPASAWQVAYGSSGTIGAISDILSQSYGAQPDAITLDGLRWLEARLIESARIDRVQLDGLKEDRKAVIGGGLSVLLAIFELLGLQSLQVSQGALRHGVLYDMIDRENIEGDARSATVNRLLKQFRADSSQAQRVAQTSSWLLDQLPVDSDTDIPRIKRKLGWAAELHEVGLLVSHSDYHKHGAYIIAHADAPGFAQAELDRLSALVLGHRGKLRKLQDQLADATFIKQLLCLRLAVIFCHSRQPPDLKGLALTGGNAQYCLHITDQWQARHPQSAYLLAEECVAWQKVGVTLELSSSL